MAASPALHVSLAARPGAPPGPHQARVREDGDAAAHTPLLERLGFSFDAKDAAWWKPLDASDTLRLLEVRCGAPAAMMLHHQSALDSKCCVLR